MSNVTIETPAADAPPEPETKSKKKRATKPARSAAGLTAAFIAVDGAAPAGNVETDVALGEAGDPP